jgi:Phosphotransferase system, mannose/fructose/N-acetylgalactosamine-specific component IID
MKKCRKCGYENADSMSFCLECGTPLREEPMVVNLSDQPTESISGTPQTNFGAARETETFAVNRVDFGGANFGNFPPPRKKSKLLPVLAGLAALLALFGIAAGAVAFFIFFNSKPVAQTTPTPTASPTESVLPTEKPSKSPSVSPTASPSAAPQTAFTPPTQPTKKGTFTVYANGGWQISDLDVVALEKFNTSVSGLIDLAGVKNNVTYAGVKDEKTKSRRIYPEYPTGALLMRTRYADGRYSNVQPVSASNSWENFPDEIGKLEFCVNDKTPENNGGQFIVTKVSVSVPKPKK